MITGASTLDPRFPTYGSMLGDLGYDAWWFGKWHLTADDRQWNEFNGPPALARYGFKGGTYPSPNGSPGQGWKVDPTIADQFSGWLATDGGLGPWCTTVSFVNPHDIAWWWRWSQRYATEASAPAVVASLPQNFETPQQLEARHKPRLQLSLQQTSASSFGVVPFNEPARTPAWLPFLDLYVKLQLEVDHHIASVLSALASRPHVMENTVVIFSADHGEYGGSHGLRGKGAGMYEEGIRVPLVVKDFTGNFNLVPGERSQITSSVDIAPLLLSVASGSGSWRASPEYAHIADRPDLLALAQDPTKPGRQWALHATDEVLTEFAVLPYAADAPLHVAGIVTPSHKYATYSHWRGHSMETITGTQEAELYDYSTAGGVMEVDNLAGRSGSEETLRTHPRPGHGQRAASAPLPGSLRPRSGACIAPLPRPRPHRAAAQLVPPPAEGRAGRRGYRARPAVAPPLSPWARGGAEVPRSCRTRRAPRRRPSARSCARSSWVSNPVLATFATSLSERPRRPRGSPTRSPRSPRSSWPPRSPFPHRWTARPRRASSAVGRSTASR